MYGKFIRRTLIIAATLLVVFALTIVVVDPFFHYHAPLKGLQPVINDERYQNSGIAERFEYDSVLIGSSMTQNFRVSEFNEIFDCDTVKLTYSAVRTGSYKEMFDRVFERRQITNVFMGLDIDPLIDTFGNYYFPLPEYLYDENAFNDVNYVLNKAVMFDNTYHYMKDNLLGTVPDIDDAYMWEGNFSKESALQSVDWDINYRGEPISHPHYLENAKLNLGKNILPAIEAHPETTFYVFLPPYSLLWWNMRLNYGDLDSILDVVEYAEGELLKYDNVKLFNFQGVEEVVTDLNLYKDYNHYGPEINSKIIGWMKEGEYQLSAETYKEELARFKDFVETFDYQTWVAE